MSNCHFCKWYEFKNSYEQNCKFKKRNKVDFGNYANTEIVGNEITISHIGIDLQSNDNANQLLINNNIINTVYSDDEIKGIQVYENGTRTSGIINYNIIHLGNSTRYSCGIEMNYTNMYDVASNSIYMDNSTSISPMNRGISLYGSQYSYLHCNYILGGNNTHDNSGSAGIYTMGATDYHYKCNAVNSCYEGIFFDGGNIGLDVNWNRLESNNISKHTYGLHLTESAFIGEQLHNGNRWLGLFSIEGAEDLNTAGAQNDQFEFNSGIPANVPLSFEPNGWFIGNSGTDLECDRLQPITYCDIDPNVLDADINISRAIRIAQDSIHSDLYDDENVYMLRRLPMKEIVKDTTLKNSYDDIGNFYTVYHNSNIKKLSRVRHGLDTLYIDSLEYADINDITGFVDNIDVALQSIAYNDSILLYDSL